MGKRIYTPRRRTDSTRARKRKRELMQYRHLMLEIGEGKARLKELRARESELATADDEVAAVRVAAKIESYREQIRRNIEHSYEGAVAIQTYINLIGDSELRRIFTLYYIKGYAWRRVARELGYTDESVPRKKHDRYILSTETAPDEGVKSH